MSKSFTILYLASLEGGKLRKYPVDIFSDEPASGGGERKRKNLIRLGVDQEHAYAWSRTRKGGWAVAQSPIMITTITLERLRKRGYVSLLEIYISLNPSPRKQQRS